MATLRFPDLHDVTRCSITVVRAYTLVLNTHKIHAYLYNQTNSILSTPLATRCVEVHPSLPACRVHLSPMRSFPSIRILILIPPDSVIIVPRNSTCSNSTAMRSTSVPGMQPRRGQAQTGAKGPSIHRFCGNHSAVNPLTNIRCVSRNVIDRAIKKVRMCGNGRHRSQKNKGVASFCHNGQCCSRRICSYNGIHPPCHPTWEQHVI